MKSFQDTTQAINDISLNLIKQGVSPSDNVLVLIDDSFEYTLALFSIISCAANAVIIQNTSNPHYINEAADKYNVKYILTRSLELKSYLFNLLKKFEFSELPVETTLNRAQIANFDQIPYPDRSLVNYEQYNNYIGMSMVKNSLTLQCTRGCPYNCTFCHKIWPKKHVVRSAKNIFDEISMHYKLGVRNFAFLDDIFNLNEKNGIQLFQLIIKNNYKLRLFFPNGLRGDVLSKEYIDYMVESGAVHIPFALESGSERIQKLIKKNIKLDVMHRNISYIIQEYPHVMVDLFTMHGFPTETEEEAMQTLEYIKSLKWLHFPYVFVVKVYPGSELASIVEEMGVEKSVIKKSMNMTYHDLPETLPFSQSFSRKYQAMFTNEYFLLKERLLKVIPRQMGILKEDELIDKYKSYLPIKLNCLDDLLDYVNITRDELGNPQFISENYGVVENLNEKTSKLFPKEKKDPDALKILLIDFSQYFSSEANRLAVLVEPPLGLLYLLTYLNEKFKENVNGKIVKSMFDFENFHELLQIVSEFKPNIIGIRALTLYKNYVHMAAEVIKQNGFDGSIIVGGPYGTSSYESILADNNIDLVVRGEGEHTLEEIIGTMIQLGKYKLEDCELEKIHGVSFIKSKNKNLNEKNIRKILFVDQMLLQIPQETTMTKREHGGSLIYYDAITDNENLVVDYDEIESIMTHRLPSDEETLRMFSNSNINELKNQVDLMRKRKRNQDVLHDVVNLVFEFE